MKSNFLKILAVLAACVFVSSAAACNKKDSQPPADNESHGQQESEDNGPDEDAEELTYGQRLSDCLKGVESSKFTEYLCSLSEYEFDCPLAGNAIYVSPEGDGVGSRSNPCSFQDALDKVRGGQTIYLRGGEYDAGEADGYFINRSGTSSAYVTIRNYPGESARIVNSSVGEESYAMQIDPKVSHVILEGLEICNVVSRSAFGIAVWGDGQSNLIIRNCNIHDIKTSTQNPDEDEDAGANAILFCGESENAISDVAVIDNFCHSNVNGWTENISVTANCENIYLIGNRVENCTNIGIDFDGNEGYCKDPSKDQPRFCIAVENVVINCNCSYAECAGVYVDGGRDILLRKNYIEGCQFGIEVGSEQRNDVYPVKNIVVEQNLCTNNLLCGIRIGGYEQVATGVVQGVEIKGNKLVENGEAEIVIAKVNGVAFNQNSILASKGSYLVSTDFSQEYCKDISFEGNEFFSEDTQAEEALFYMFGGEYVGINAFNALVAGNNSYSRPQGI